MYDIMPPSRSHRYSRSRNKGYIITSRDRYTYYRCDDDDEAKTKD